jgi:two-component system cell cycle response regulator
VALRTRLALAFVFVVLVPVLVGSVIVLISVPRILHNQIGGRLRTASVGVADVLAARCVQATQAAQLLGLEVATSDPASAVKFMVESHAVDYAVVEGPNQTIVASAGQLPRAQAPTPLPEVLDSCGNGQDAGVAISSRARLAIAASPSLTWVAVAWSAGPAMTTNLSGSLVGRQAVTLVANGTSVSSTVVGSQALRQATAVRSLTVPRVLDAGSHVLAFVPPSTGQPYGVIVSEPAPDITKLTLALVGIVLITVLGGMGMGRLLARLISRPVVELSEAAGRAASGDLDITIPVRSRDEVGRLATAFNHMTSELQTYIRQLESSRDELRQNLDRLGATLTHTHDLGGILAVVLETAIGSVQAQGGTIMFLDGEGSLTVKVRRGAAAESVPIGAVVPVGKGIAGRVASTGEPARGVVGDGPGLRPAPTEPNATTVIAVPLRQSGRIVGVLNLYDKDGDRPFTPHDLETILAFATQASVAIDNVLLHQEAQRLSLTDPLTGLWNYRYLTLGLGHEIERATRFGRPLAVLMLDLDRFKSINDQHGHQVGDAVLIELAGRMRAEVREVDTVARYGGEEFVIVLPETDAAGAARLADRLGTVIRSSPFCGDVAAFGGGLAVTASIGAAVFPEHGSTPSRLLRSSDDALYAAKDGGRDGWRFASGPSEAGDSDIDTGSPSMVPQLGVMPDVVVPDVQPVPPGEAHWPRTSDS